MGCECVVLSFLPHMIPTRYVKASLEDLVHGLGVVMVMSQQLRAVAHHGPATSIFMLMHRERGTKKQCKPFFQLFYETLGVLVLKINSK